MHPILRKMATLDAPASPSPLPAQDTDQGTAWQLTLWLDKDLSKAADQARALACAFPAALPASSGFWQMERCPKTNALHLQGYFKLQSNGRAKPLRKRMDALLTEHGVETKAWFCLAKGSPLDNWNYCTKPDTRVVDAPMEDGSTGSISTAWGLYKTSPPKASQVGATAVLT